QDKLTFFRIKELKDVLTHLGLSKQGKKQDLVDRILAIISDEQVSKMWAKKNAVRKEDVVKLVEDTYRKMQSSGATDLASKGPSVSDISSVKPKEEAEDPYLDMKVRCPCGSSLLTESTIQCEDPKCRVWQHMGCVVIPEKPTEDASPPNHFYCEICRLSRADPFWLTVAHPLNPVKLTQANMPTDGSNPMQSMERTFQLTRADKDLVQKPEYDVQAWCMLLNDKVPYRMQWPQYADLQVNGVPVRAINRPGSQLLGANGRDDGPIITPCTRDGINKISLTGCDARIFCLGVRIVKRRTLQQILSMIPKEEDGELFEDALARVCRCIGGGNATENADSDSDLEVVAESVSVNLRCPMSGSRMKIAGRFKPCAHMGCFDLETFWQCPICLKNYSLENLIIDPYFNRIASLMRPCGEDINEIEVKPDGSWRVKNENECRDLAQWHFPDGTLCASVDGEIKSKLEGSKQVKQEGCPEGHGSLKLGIKKNRNGIWELSKPDGMHTLSSGGRLLEKIENHGQHIIPMSSSGTGSGRDGEDPSVNQECGGNFDFSTNNGIELDSIPLNIDPPFGLTSRNPSAPEAEVIVLSDSEDDDAMMSHDTIYRNGRAEGGGPTFPIHNNGIVDSYQEDHTLGNGSSSCLGLFNANEDDFGMAPLWQLHSATQAGPAFQLFGSDADVSDALVDLQHGSMNCSTSMNGYTLAPDTTIETAGLVPDSSVCCSNANMNDGLVDNPLAFGGDDPSLQIFLPTRPSDTAVQSNIRDQADVSNGIRSEDWISLRLGGGAGGGGGSSRVHTDPTCVNGLDSRQQFAPKEGAMDSLTDTGMNDGRSDKSSHPRSERFGSIV
ncbi:Zinc finger, MIZ-type, partial [Dillenia turbinata]